MIRFPLLAKFVYGFLTSLLPDDHKKVILKNSKLFIENSCLSHWHIKRDLAIYIRYHIFEFRETGFSRTFMRTMDAMQLLATSGIWNIERLDKFRIFWNSPTFRLRGPIKRRKLLQLRKLQEKVSDIKKNRPRHSSLKAISSLGGYVKQKFDETLLECVSELRLPPLVGFTPTLNLLKGSYSNLVC